MFLLRLLDLVIYVLCFLSGSQQLICYCVSVLLAQSFEFYLQNPRHLQPLSRRVNLTNSFLLFYSRESDQCQPRSLLKGLKTMVKLSVFQTLIYPTHPVQQLFFHQRLMLLLLPLLLVAMSVPLNILFARTQRSLA